MENSICQSFQCNDRIINLLHSNAKSFSFTEKLVASSSDSLVEIINTMKV